MSKVLIIGAGGVGSVVAHKCAMNSGVFSEIMLASRTKAKCDKIAAEIKEMHGVEIKTAQVDADIVAETVILIKQFQPKLLINVALPYQDLTLMAVSYTHLDVYKRQRLRPLPFWPSTNSGGMSGNWRTSWSAVWP